MARITCARLDERGVYQGMVELDAADLGPLHLPQITACDQPVGEVRWVPDPANSYGGAFVPLPKAQRAQAGRPTLEQAVAFDLLHRWEQGSVLTAVSLAWLDDVLQSWDARAFLGLESVQAYGRSRGLPFATKEG